MDKWQAQQQFWEGFDLPAYDDQTLFREGDEPAFPHITYEAVNGVLDQSTSVSVSLWYKSPSWREISQKSDEIQAVLSNGAVIPVDNGYLWLKMPLSTPFAQRIASGSDDDLIKRMMLTVEIEALSAT